VQYLQGYLQVSDSLYWDVIFIYQGIKAIKMLLVVEPWSGQVGDENNKKCFTFHIEIVGSIYFFKDKNGQAKKHTDAARSMTENVFLIPLTVSHY